MLVGSPLLLHWMDRMGEVSGYTMDLYCDCPTHSYFTPGTASNPGDFFGNNRTECLQNARRAGWLIRVGDSGRKLANENVAEDDRMGVGYAVCPECRKKK